MPLGLQNVWIAWDTDAGSTCANTTTCGDYPPAKCYKNIDPVGVDILVPNFDVACGSVPLEFCFTDMTMGGTPYTQGGMTPYSYSWDFGDGNSSTQQHPCHTFGDIGPHTIQLDVTDSAGVTASVFRTIMLDTFNCCSLTVTCPSTTTFNLTCNDPIPDCTDSEDAFEALTGANISNQCSTVVVSCDDNGSVCAGQIVRVITISDGSSMETCTLTYNFSAPAISITCPANVRVDCSSAIPAVNTNSVSASGGCTPLTIAHVSDASDNASCPETITRTYKATDACGNSVVCTQTITVSDTLPPVPPAAPADLNLQCAVDVPAAIDLTATDNCDGDITVSPLTQITPGACINDFVMVRTWTFTDNCGNASSISQTITVLDTLPPVPPAAPADLHLQCAVDVPPAVDLTASDNCDGDITVSPVTQITPGACINDFVMVRTWTFTDICGNASSISQTITVLDTLPPVPPAAPADVSLQCAVDVPPAVDLTASDNCDGDITVSPVTQITPGACINDFVMVRTWTFTDICGNASSISQTITVLDTLPPVPPAAPADVSLQCAVDVPPAVDLTASDNCDGDITVSPVAQITQGTCLNDFVMVRTWTFTDLCGNASSVSQTITVDDTTPPTINCPAGFQVAGLQNVPACNPNDASASDNCGAVTITCTQGPLVGDGCIGTVTNTYTATDACGNTATCTQVITVIDTEDPNLSCPSDQPVEGCAPEDIDEVSALPLSTQAQSCITLQEFQNEGGSASDNCQVNVCYQDIVSGPCPYTVRRVFYASDNSANEVTCTTTYTITPPPLVLHCPTDTLVDEDQSQAVVDQAFEDWKDRFSHSGGCNATVTYKINDVEIDLDTLPAPEACGGDVTLEMVVESLCSSDSCESSFTVIASVEGLLLALPGMQSTCSNSPQPPTLADLPAARSDAEIISAFLQASACVDMGQLTINHLESGPTIMNGNEYLFQRTYFVSGPNNLATQATEEFMILHDPDAPILSGLPQDLILPCGSDIPAMPTVTAYDVVFGDVEVLASSRRIPSGCGGYRVRRSWTARDGCGNVAQGVQIIAFEDNEPPILTVPADTVLECSAMIPEPSHTVSDACSDVRVVLVETLQGDPECEHSIIRTWTAIDGCDNRVSKSQTIQIVDTEAPVITVVNPMLVDVPNGGEIVMYNCDNPQVAMSDIEVSDCCDVTVELSDRLVASSVCEIFGYYRKWICSYVATDAAGNVAEHSFYVLQYDTTAPTIHNVPGYLEVACDSMIPLPDSTVYGEDDCVADMIPVFEEDTITDPSDASKFALIRTWSMEDRCGNHTEASQVIAVCGFDTTLITAGLGNTVWVDSDADGLQDAGEPGLNDVKIYLYCPDETLGLVRIDSTVTRRSEGQDGQFFFNHLMPDDYQLQFVVPADWKLTLANQGEDDQIDSDANEITGMTEIISLTTFDKLTNFDAGMVSLSALPVELSNFWVVAEGCNSRLRWSTLSEHGTELFEIQRSSDGIVFQTIGVIDAAGNSTETVDYTFLDTEALAKNTYRIRIMDVDGAEGYSGLRSLNHQCRDRRGAFTVFPNPSHGVFNLTFNLNEHAPVDLRIYDKLGQIVLSQKRDMSPGRQFESLDLQRLPNGIYNLQITIDGIPQHRTIVKTK